MPINIHRALVQTARAQQNMTRPGIYEIGLSPGQPKILTYLINHDSCMQKDIAEALDIEPASVSQILCKMEQAGLIQRLNFGERKRADCVSITDEGRKAYKKWLRICGKTDNISFRGFTKQEQEQMLSYLCRMYRNLTGKDLT